MTIAVSVVNDNNTVHLATLQMEPICGDYCSWCGECIVCAVEPAHASPWRMVHLHYINYTETQARQRGLEW